MKKTLMIALAGMMLFAFTQCGGNGNDKETGTKNDSETKEKVDEKAPAAKGTKQFTELMSAYEELGKAIKEIKNCEELEQISMALVLSDLAIELGGDEYTAEEKLTEKEKGKLKEFTEKLVKEVEKKSEELGCEKKEYNL